MPAFAHPPPPPPRASLLVRSSMPALLISSRSPVAVDFQPVWQREVKGTGVYKEFVKGLDLESRLLVSPMFGVWWKFERKFYLIWINRVDQRRNTWELAFLVPFPLPSSTSLSSDQIVDYMSRTPSNSHSLSLIPSDQTGWTGFRAESETVMKMGKREIEKKASRSSISMKQANM